MTKSAAVPVLNEFAVSYTAWQFAQNKTMGSFMQALIWHILVPYWLFAKSCKVCCVVWHKKGIGFSLYEVPCQEKLALKGGCWRGETSGIAYWLWLLQESGGGAG